MDNPMIRNDGLYEARDLGLPDLDLCENCQEEIDPEDLRNGHIKCEICRSILQ